MRSQDRSIQGLHSCSHGYFTQPQETVADLMDIGEGMSILKDGTIKFNCDMCFTNYVNNPITGEKMSMTPEASVYNTWTGPDFVPFFKERARMTFDGLYGKEVENIAIESYRICW